MRLCTFITVIQRIKGIHGEIAPSYVDEKGLFHKGTTLLDLIEQMEGLPKETTEVEIPIASPGGYVDIGTDMYNYLVEYKKSTGRKLTTIQVGLVGSIATKPFLAGDQRLVDDRYELFIHNPSYVNVTGDQDELRAKAKDLENTENDLRAFYQQFNSINSVGLDALMKQETSLTADQAIKFGFATGKVKVPALNIIKMSAKKEEKKDEKSLKEQLLALLGIEEKPKGVAPKAQVPGQVEKKSMVVTLADNAGSFWVEGDQLSEGAPAFLLDESGQPTMEPVADGEYKLEDGTMVTVAGGMVSAVVAGSSEEEAALTQEQVQALITEAVAKQAEEHKKEIEALKAQGKKDVEDAIVALKKDVKLGIQPKKAALTNNGGKLEYQSIHERMKAKKEERKKQLNGSK